jgi:hypothetical protein
MFDLQFLRKFLAWNFAFLSLLCTLLAFRIIWSTLHLQIEKVSSHPVVLLADAVFPAFAVAFGVAWWKVWKQRPFARAWGVVASIPLAAVPLWRIIWVPHSVRGYTLVVLAVGIAGVVVFAMPDKAISEADDPELEEPSTEGI